MRYGERYVINKSDKVVIYGAATTGAIIHSVFMKEGFEVIAFVDKRADEIDSYYGLPVLNLEQTEELLKENEEIIVIIGIKNVFEHEAIARRMWGLGCDRIIFRPYDEVKGEGKEKDKILNEVYSAIMAGKIPEEAYAIEAFEEHVLQDKALIESDSDSVVANIPVYYIFTDLYKDIDILWGDIPCLGLIPHIGLFNLFQGIENEDYHEYIKFCREAALRSGGIKITKAWEESVYRNRLDVFNHMQYEWEHDRGFFVKNAVWVDYNEKGYFNIKSGKHRVVFMLVKGKRYIPLRIKKSDYEKWSNISKAEKIKCLLHRSDRESLPVVLGNPFFYDYPCSTSPFYEQVLIKLLSTIYQARYYEQGRFDFNKDCILLYNTPLAMYAHVFRMIGFEVDIVEESDEDKVIYEAVAEQGIKGDIETDKKYFLAVIEGEEIVNVGAENVLIISNHKDSTGKTLVGGFGESGFLYAVFVKGI